MVSVVVLLLLRARNAVDECVWKEAGGWRLEAGGWRLEAGGIP
jgi:hypothetical protein